MHDFPSLVNFHVGWKYRDDAGGTVEENSSIFSLVEQYFSASDSFSRFLTLYKFIAALLSVARVTACLAESNGSLPPDLWLKSPAGWLPSTGISSAALHSAIEYGLPLPFFNLYHVPMWLVSRLIRYATRSCASSRTSRLAWTTADDPSSTWRRPPVIVGPRPPAPSRPRPFTSPSLAQAPKLSSAGYLVASRLPSDSQHSAARSLPLAHTHACGFL